MPPKPLLDGPIPLQSWQHAPRTMPWDRPPQFADVNKGLIFLFKKLRQPDASKSILNLIDSGIPIDFIAEQILVQGFQQGTYGASALVPMCGPLIIILLRMGESAGLHPVTSAQINKVKQIDPSEILADQARNNQVNKAQGAIDKSSDLTSGKENEITAKGGFMKPKKSGGLI